MPGEGVDPLGSLELLILPRSPPTANNQGRVRYFLFHQMHGDGALTTHSSRISALGGYQAEYHVYFVGLDMEEKARWTEDHVREAIGDRIKKFSLLKFHVNGTSPVDAPNQDLATVDMRIFAQSPDRETLNMKDPDSFGRLVMSLILESAPVSARNGDRHFNVDSNRDRCRELPSVTTFVRSSPNHLRSIMSHSSRNPRFNKGCTCYSMTATCSISPLLV